MDVAMNAVNNRDRIQRVEHSVRSVKASRAWAIVRRGLAAIADGSEICQQHVRVALCVVTGCRVSSLRVHDVKCWSTLLFERVRVPGREEPCGCACIALDLKHHVGKISACLSGRTAEDVFVARSVTRCSRLRGRSGCEVSIEV
jgi:hypothetical protein